MTSVLFLMFGRRSIGLFYDVCLLQNVFTCFCVCYLSLVLNGVLYELFVLSYVFYTCVCVVHMFLIFGMSVLVQFPAPSKTHQLVY